MADKKDSMGFVDSPWVQIGVPLAATIASAIAPRHAGRAAAGTLATLDSVNQYRGNQKRLSMLQAEEDARQQEAIAKNEALRQRRLSTLGFIDKISEKPPTADAPAGGNVVEANENARTEAINGGKVPKATSILDGQDADVARQMLDMDPDGSMVEKFLTDRLSEYHKKAGMPHVEEIRGKYPLGPGESLSVDTQEGHYGYNPPEAAKPEKPYMTIEKQCGQKVGVFFTMDGVQKKVPLGPADVPDDQLKAGFDQKVYLISIGKTGIDPQLEKVMNQQEAAAYLEKKKQDRMSEDEAFRQSVRDAVLAGLKQQQNAPPK